MTCPPICKAFPYARGGGRPCRVVGAEGSRRKARSRSCPQGAWWTTLALSDGCMRPQPCAGSVKSKDHRAGEACPLPARRGPIWERYRLPARRSTASCTIRTPAASWRNGPPRARIGLRSLLPWSQAGRAHSRSLSHGRDALEELSATRKPGLAPLCGGLRDRRSQVCSRG
jgi:hypothetical protein